MRYVDRCGLAAEQCKVPEAGRAGRGRRASSGPRPREQAARNKSERGEWKHADTSETPAGETPAGETPAGEAPAGRRPGCRSGPGGRAGGQRRGSCRGDRKSVVEGKGVSVRVDLGGGRCIKKK